MKGKKLIQADAVAELLDVDRYRVYEMVRSGMIPAVRMGRSIRFDPERLDAWIASGGTAGEYRTTTADPGA
jgi:excisionase family DNA binding protein